MVTRHEHNGFVWLDVVSPSLDEVKEIMGTYNIHPRIAEALLRPSLKPSLDTDGSFLYLVLHFPAERHTKSEDANQEVNFIVGKKVFITTRYDSIDSLHKFSKEFEVHAVINEEHNADTPVFIFYHMLKKLYSSVEHELEFIQATLQEIEEHIFAGEEKEMVVDISVASRILLDFKRTLRSHIPALRRLSEVTAEVFDKNSGVFSAKAILEHQRIMGIIENLQETVDELRRTNDSLLTTKQNEVMKVLTIMAFVTFPLMLVTSMFGMNVKRLPIVGHPYDFWIIIFIMFSLTLMFFAFFKYKKWL